MEKDENKELENDTHTTDPQQHEIDGNVFGALFDKLVKPLDGPDFLEPETIYKPDKQDSKEQE